MKITSFANWGISAKILAVAFVAMTAMLIAVWFEFLPTMKDGIMDGKAATLDNVLDVAVTHIQEAAEAEASGKMSREQAQKAGLEMLRKVRYGDGNYLFVMDLSSRMLMHPTKPELEGKDLSGDKDPDGKALFVEMAEIAKKSAKGSISYKWPRPGANDPVSKISSVRLYEPWGWVIGTGFYVEDVEKQINRMRLNFLAVFLVCIIIAAAFSRYTSSVIIKPVKRALDYCEVLAGGDLTPRVKADTTDESGRLLESMNRMAENLDETMKEVHRASLRVQSSSMELSATSEEVAAGSHAQEGDAAQVAAAMEQMSSTVLEVARNSAEAADSASQAAEAARTGGVTVGKTVDRMENIARTTKETAELIGTLGQSSDKIGEIVSVINDIADQTNLLALNAAIEAARAGEQGRGFAVVADEVRKLAERTSKATKEIAGMIRAIQSDTKGAVAAMAAGSAEVEEGVELARSAGRELEEIVGQVGRVTEMIQRIAAASEEQGTTSEEISRNVENIAENIKRNSSSAQSSSNSAQDMSALAGELQSVLKKFIISAGDGDAQGKTARQDPGSGLQKRGRRAA